MGEVQKYHLHEAVRSFQNAGHALPEQYRLFERLIAIANLGVLLVQAVKTKYVRLEYSCRNSHRSPPCE